MMSNCQRPVKGLKDTEEVTYDNQLGKADDADPVTAIGGGSIVVHKEK